MNFVIHLAYNIQSLLMLGHKPQNYICPESILLALCKEMCEQLGLTVHHFLFLTYNTGEREIFFFFFLILRILVVNYCFVLLLELLWSSVSNFRRKIVLNY